MTILVDRGTRVLVQGITGSVGSFQAGIMREYGTNVVAGVTPGKGGSQVHGIPVYDFVQDAVTKVQPDAAISFVPARFARDAAIEAIDAGISFLVLTAEGIPVHDLMSVLALARRNGSRVLGPDTPGLVSPGQCKLGVHPCRMLTEGHVGVLSKSGALSYEVCKVLTQHGLGQSTVVGIGGGPLWGLTQVDVLAMFQEDPDTDVVVLLGEVGGRMELEAAAFIREYMDKPVIALIVGRAAPDGAQMGHAGAIIDGEETTAAYKMEALERAGAIIIRRPTDIPEIVKTLGA